MFSPSTNALYAAHAQAEIAKRLDYRHIVIGLGNVIVGYTMLGGIPGMTFTTVEDARPIGTPADGIIPGDRLMPGSVVLSFANAEGAVHHMQRFEGLFDWMKRISEENAA